MNDFDRLIEESYRGFGTSARLDLDELRLLYYGRKDIYISFSDKGDYYFETQSRELHRPDSILCFAVNDVVGRKVTSSEFYANVFRPRITGRRINDVRRYDRDDLNSDLILLQRELRYSDDDWIGIVSPILRDTTIRFDFDRLWDITDDIARRRGGDHGQQWNWLLRKVLKISIISDPDGTGNISFGRQPTTLFIDYNNKSDLDILPIQANRIDPRKHTRERVERKVQRMGVKRNRIAKRRVDQRIIAPRVWDRMFGL